MTTEIAILSDQNLDKFTKQELADISKTLGKAMGYWLMDYDQNKEVLVDEATYDAQIKKWADADKSAGDKKYLINLVTRQLKRLLALKDTNSVITNNTTTTSNTGNSTNKNEPREFRIDQLPIYKGHKDEDLNQ